MQMAETEHWGVGQVSLTTRVRMACLLIELKAYLDLKCLLGEAPFYEEDSHSLRFVDIDKGKLHRIDLNRGPSSLQTFDLDVAVR